MNIKVIFKKILSSMKGPGFFVKFWDGEELHCGDQAQTKFKIIFHKEPKTPSDDLLMYFGESYMDGVFDLEGDWDALFGMIENNNDLFQGSFILNSAKLLSNTLGKLKRKQKENIAHHYDLGNDFYKLWLDENMLYSCAFFHSPSDTLEKAQQNKLNLCLDKLQLVPGMTLLDIGCGWGQLAIAAAKRGVKVVGISLSEEQVALGREKVRTLGLEDLVDIRLMDYLDLNGSEQFDRIVSVGMFEHVGEANYKAFFKHSSLSLKDGGLMLLHTITRHHYGQTNSWLKKYIFPGGHIPTVSAVVENLPEQKYELIHMDSLRLHYAYTLEHWLKRFEAAKGEVLKKFDERFIRMWRLYLKGSAANFRGADLDIHQFLMSKGVRSHQPMHMGAVYPTARPVAIWDGKLKEETVAVVSTTQSVENA